MRVESQGIPVENGCFSLEGIGAVVIGMLVTVIIQELNGDGLVAVLDLVYTVDLRGEDGVVRKLAKHERKNPSQQ